MCYFGKEFIFAMKKALIAITSITLFSSTAWSQGMRDTIQEYESSKQCFSDEIGGSKEVCLYGNGNVHHCPDLVFAYGLISDCAEARVFGKLNHRFRDDGELTEFYKEGRNLIKYWCYEGAYMKCDGKPEKVVYYPL